MRMRLLLVALVSAFAFGGTANAQGILDNLFKPVPAAPPTASKSKSAPAPAPAPAPQYGFFGFGGGYAAPNSDQQYNSGQALWPEDVSPYRVVPAQFRRLLREYTGAARTLERDVLPR